MLCTVQALHHKGPWFVEVEFLVGGLICAMFSRCVSVLFPDSVDVLSCQPDLCSAVSLLSDSDQIFKRSLIHGTHRAQRIMLQSGGGSSWVFSPTSHNPDQDVLISCRHIAVWRRVWAIWPSPGYRSRLHHRDCVVSAPISSQSGLLLRLYAAHK